MREPMDLDEIICRSICSNESSEMRRRLSESIVLVGGTTKIQEFVNMVEDSVFTRMRESFDESVERVEVLLVNV